MLDVCLTSNRLLGVYDLEEHPLPALLGAGISCSLNADDSSLFDTDLVGEYEIARGVLGLSDEQLAGVARSSLVGSAAPEDLRRQGLAGIDAWLAPPAGHNDGANARGDA